MLVSSYPRRSDDSASIFLRKLAESLRDRGLAVHVLAPADGRAGMTSENGVIVRRFRYFAGPWEKLAYGSGILSNLRRNPLLWIQVPFFVVSMAVSLCRYLHKVRPDVLHAHWVIPQGLVAILGKLFYGVPTIITLHGGDAFALTSTPLQALKRFALQHCDAWTTNTRSTSTAIAGAVLNPQPHVIPMGVNVGHFASGQRHRLREGIPDDACIVLFVGRLVEKKGVDDLLRAFSMLPSSVSKKANLWIVGDGEQRAWLQTLAAHLGISTSTTFWGRIANEQLPDYYAAADLFVGPSVVAQSGDTEGQGVVFLEAFAARLCVLATRTGGIEEIVEDANTGVLVEPRNPKQLAKAMAQLLTDDQRRATLATRALKKVKTTYDWRKIALDFATLYQSVSMSSAHPDDRSISAPE